MIAAAVGDVNAAVTLTPASPTSSDTITATIDVAGNCDTASDTVVSGNVVRTTITYTVCYPVTPFPAQTSVEFGPLAAGSYTYEVYVGFADGPPPARDSEQPLTVAAAPAGAAIPALDNRAIAILTLALCAAAMLMLRRSV